MKKNNNPEPEIEQYQESKDPEQEVSATENNTNSETKPEGESQEKEQVKEEVTEPNFEFKYNEMNDKYLRLSAEFDNYRKRTLKEKMELIKNAGEDILVNFLPVVDNLERAKKSVDDAKELESIKIGVSLIYNSLTDFLKQRGIKEIEAKDTVFDLDKHEAITKIVVADDMKGKVVDVIEKGYTLNDKIVRYAKVVVGE